MFYYQKRPKIIITKWVYILAMKPLSKERQNITVKFIFGIHQSNVMNKYIHVELFTIKDEIKAHNNL